MLKNLVLIGISFIAGCFITIHQFAPSKNDAHQQNLNAAIHNALVSTNEVYICKGPSSKRYHYKKTCRGLKPCSTEIFTVTLKEAKQLGRTLCGWED